MPLTPSLNAVPGVSRPRRLALAGLLLALAGCGGAKSPAVDTLAPAAAVRAAVTTTTHQASSRLVLDTRTDIGAVSVDLHADGVIDYTHGTGRISLTVPGPAGKIEEILATDVLYLRVPGQGDAYYALNRRDVLGTSLASSADPTSGLHALTAFSGGVKAVGTETIRGTHTNHYRGTADLARAAAQASGLVKAALQQLLSNGTISTVPFDAYIDSAGRLRKLVQSFTITSPKLPGQQVHSQSTVEYYDFGVPVSVTKPAVVKDGAALLTIIKKQFAASH